ncbi:hypothetical protein Hanom_Chr14g01272341 [Helianthus anomalus]
MVILWVFSFSICGERERERKRVVFLCLIVVTIKSSFRPTAFKADEIHLSLTTAGTFSFFDSQIDTFKMVTC